MFTKLPVLQWLKNGASVCEQQQFDAPWSSGQARQGRERQPSVAAHNIWMTLYKKQIFVHYASLQQKEATKWRLQMVKSIGTALKNKIWWPMTSGDWRHLSFPIICLILEEKPQPGKLTRLGIKPRPARWEATMLPLATVVVDMYLHNGLIPRIILCNGCKSKGSW